jgi:transcriptional regulator with XRE-family HTH domain
LRVAKNLRDVRKVSVRELAARLKQLGRPLYASAISKIELGQRRIDVDELVAISIALDVSPNLLLIGPRADWNEDVQLTEGSTKVETGEVDTEPSAAKAWKWARGIEPLDAGGGTRPLPEDDEEEDRFFEDLFAQIQERTRRFQRQNQPDDPPDQTDFTALPVELRAALDTVAEHAVSPVLKAQDQGLTLKQIMRYLLIRVNQVHWERMRKESQPPMSREEVKRAADEVMRRRHPGTDAPEGD